MSKNTQKKNINLKREYKLDIKRFALYWLICLPFIFALSVGLSFTSLNSQIKILLIVVFGILVCLGCELIHILKLKKEETNPKPKKKDPFAD